MWLLFNVAAIHELPLHIVTEAFLTIDVFEKLNRNNLTTHFVFFSSLRWIITHLQFQKG